MELTKNIKKAMNMRLKIIISYASVCIYPRFPRYMSHLAIFSAHPYIYINVYITFNRWDNIPKHQHLNKKKKNLYTEHIHY